MKFNRFIALIGLISLILLYAAKVEAGSAIKRVSTNAGGGEANYLSCSAPMGQSRCNGRTYYQSISADGRYIAFVSTADNLVAGDTNDTADIFVKDRLTGAIVRASTDSGGNQANGANTSGFTGSHHPSISADGRYVAFESYANNLVVGDTNDSLDVFVKDLQTGTVARVVFNGVQGDNGAFAPVISGNGRYVAFISTSTNIYPAFAAAFRVYRFDLQTGDIVTVAGGQTSPTNRDFDVNTGASLAISADGRYVAFGAKEPGFTWWRVIRRDLTATTLSVASVSNGGSSADNHSSWGNGTIEQQNIDMTPDGRYVVFTSDADNLDPGDTNNNRDVFLRDFQTSTTTLISRDPVTNQSLVAFFIGSVCISADASLIAFDYTPNNFTGYTIKVLDRSFNVLRQVPYPNPAGSGSINHPIISDSGRYLMFDSTRADLVPNDTSANNFPDTFFVDLLTAPSHRNGADFDGEGFADLSVFRPSDGNWYWLRSNDGASNVVHWGASGDIPVAGDFDGDAKSDLTVFRPSNGGWYMIRSATNTISIQHFGLNGDKPVAADYDGDEKTDLAVWRPSDRVWYIAQSGGGFRFQQWGLSTDKPTVGDFDGDGRSDLAVYRPSTGVWYLLENPSGGSFRALSFGLSGDRPVPADYNGDGITDIAVYRPSTGVWYFNNSRRMLPGNPNPLQYDFSAVQWGISEDLPVASDFDGDGRADISVFRPSSGVWYQFRSSGGTQIQQFGLSGDIPIGYSSESN